MKKYIRVIILLTIILIGIFYLNKSEKVSKHVLDSQNMCFLYEIGEEDSKSKYSLNVDINENEVSGGLNFFPFESDSKFGQFTGLIGERDSATGFYPIVAWWDNLAEGMTAREQLVILLDNDSASIGFGEMVNISDNTYAYKDTNEISYSLILERVDCENIKNLI